MMKKLLIIALCAVIPMVGFAQKKAKKGKKVEEVTVPVVEVMSDEECMENISLFQSYVKAGDWAGAYEFWLPVYQSRPEFRSQIYTNGAKILEYRYSQAQTDAERHALRDSIMKLHDDRIKYFDDTKYPDAYVLGLKAKDYLTFFTEDELAMTAYEWLKESVTTLGANAQVDVTRKLMEQSYKIYKSNPEQYGSQFLSDYELVSITFDLMVKAGGKNATQAQNEKAYADRMYAVSGAADCGTMDEKFASKVAESANDMETLMSIMKLYRRMDCTESDVYFAAVESAHKLQPSAESAAGCAQMCLKKGDLTGAVDYYKQALTLVESDEDKADYLYRMANVYVSLQNYRQSVEYANQALEINPEDGRCYLLIGMSYANGGKISDDPVLDRAKFWVACDMFQKAQSIDETCADAAKNFIKTYSQYFPTKEEIFFSRDLNEGQSYYVGSWINKSTRCRARKE